MKRDSATFSADCISPSEQAAADWLALRDQGLSPTQQAEFERWCAAAPRHVEIFAELEETWRLLNRVREVAPAGRLRRLAWLALPLAAVLAVGYLGWWQPAHRALFAEVAVTEVGRQQTLELPDGSVVQLNTDSAVDVHYTTAERRVQLVRGEAHFNVAKNPSRPFIAEAGAVAVRAVGTVFDVRLRPETVEVLVIEGKVRVDDTLRNESLLPAHTAAESPLLLAGERIVIPIQVNAAAPAPLREPATIVTMEPQEIQRALAWQEFRLEFVAVPLSEIVEEFNRYNRHKLVIANPRLAAQGFGGSFRADEPATLVRLLGRSFSIIAEERENETILRLAP